MKEEDAVIRCDSLFVLNCGCGINGNRALPEWHQFGPETVFETNTT
jgi:hypothetical protein